MKKNLPLLIGGLFLTFAFIFLYSCSKEPEEATTGTTAVPDKLLEAAKNWHSQNTKNVSVLGISNTKKVRILAPTWEDAKTLRPKSGGSKLIVPGPDYVLDPKSDKGAIRKFVFNVEKGKVADGVIIELYGDREDVAQRKASLLEKYVEGDLAGFTGSVITYDVNYNYIKGEVYKDGVKLNRNVGLRRDHGEHKAAAKNGGKADSPIRTLSDCWSVYYVETYSWGGYSYETWTYLYGYCNSDDTEYGGGGGGGGGYSGLPYVDCAGVTDGSAYTDLLCGCIGGTTGIAFCPPDPCAEAKRLEKNANYKAEMLRLKSETNNNYESGYLKLSTGPVPEYRTGTPGTLGLAMPGPSTLADKSLEYISHNHYDDPNSLSIFGSADVDAFSQYIHADKVVNKNTFTFSVTTADGTSYALVLEDETKLNAFYSTYSGEIGQRMLHDLIGKYVNANNSNSTNELKFMEMLHDLKTGISLLKANSDFTDWNKVEYNPDSSTTSTSNCN